MAGAGLWLADGSSEGRGGELGRYGLWESEFSGAKWDQGCSFFLLLFFFLLVVLLFLFFLFCKTSQVPTPTSILPETHTHTGVTGTTLQFSTGWGSCSSEFYKWGALRGSCPFREGLVKKGYARIRRRP